MPKNKLKLTLLANYDAAHDRISITADKSEKDLADGGLYITLKPGTPSETLLRKRLMDAGLIKRQTLALTLDQLVELGAIKKSQATVLQLLARDRRGVLFQGSSRYTTQLAAAYLDAARSPRVIVVDDQQELTGRQNFSNLLDSDVVYLSTTQDSSTTGKPADYDWLIQQAYRMRPDFIIQDLQGSTRSLAEMPKAADGIGMIYLDQGYGMGAARLPGDREFAMAQANPGYQNVNLSAIVHVGPSEREGAPLTIDEFDLL